MAHRGTIKPDASDRERAPAAFIAALLVVLAVIIAGSLYLTVVRGEALFLDLAGLSGLLFCF
ncbi:MAG: hypothetical protein KDJ37_04710 [Hyphomicrobiaceae bacterium]|nr:hypothetical protein [Hyphomicrobiaceae bacterium]